MCFYVLFFYLCITGALTDMLFCVIHFPLVFYYFSLFCYPPFEIQNNEIQSLS